MDLSKLTIDELKKEINKIEFTIKKQSEPIVSVLKKKLKKYEDELNGRDGKSKPKKSPKKAEPKKTDKKAKAESVTIYWAEGDQSKLDKFPKTYYSWEDASNAIKPLVEKGLGYNKVKYTITFDDGSEYGGRLDVSEKEDNPIRDSKVFANTPKKLLEYLVKEDGDKSAKEFLDTHDFDSPMVGKKKKETKEPKEGQVYKINDKSKSIKARGEIIITDISGGNVTLEPFPLKPKKKMSDTSILRVGVFKNMVDSGDYIHVKDIELKEEPKTKKYKLGDMYSSDFDYEGMMAYADKVDEKTALSTLEKLSESMHDVNYHTEAKRIDDLIKKKKDSKKETPKPKAKTFELKIDDKVYKFNDEASKIECEKAIEAVKARKKEKEEHEKAREEGREKAKNTPATTRIAESFEKITKSVLREVPETAIDKKPKEVKKELGELEKAINNMFDKLENLLDKKFSKESRAKILEILTKFEGKLKEKEVEKKELGGELERKSPLSFLNW